jgi:hypothetical protein
MLPRPPSVLDDLERVPAPRGLQRIAAFSVHMRCDGTSHSKIVQVRKRSVERGLRPPTSIGEVQNVDEGPVLLEMGYGFDAGDDRLEQRIDEETILGAWVTEQGNPKVHTARLTRRATFRDGGTTQYGVELELPKRPGTYVPLRNVVGDKTVTLTIVFRQ